MKRMKERDRESEKRAQPDKSEVICPMIFNLTHLAVNYDLTWQPETKITVEDDEGFTSAEVTGVWKSNPVQRGHTSAFQAELQRMRESGEISWDEQAYYFTHEEGIEARKAYEQLVLDGKIKAHITSWGPNPKKADDKSRFHKFTGVTFQELEEKYPDLYKTPTRSIAKRHEPEEEVKEEVKEDEPEPILDPVAEPTSQALHEIEEEQRVAAATTTEDTIDTSLVVENEDDDRDDHDTIPLYVSSDMVAERIDTSQEAIGWRSDGEEHTAYLMELPEIGKDMWLEVGSHTIDGVTYDIRLQD